jgi:hypothetical protein
MYTKIINQFSNDNFEEFEFRVNRECFFLEEKNHNIVDIQFLSQNKLLIAIVKYK